jgi:hypothetical protein
MSFELPGPADRSPVLELMFSIVISSSVIPWRAISTTTCLIDSDRSRPPMVRPAAANRTPSRAPPWMLWYAM